MLGYARIAPATATAAELSFTLASNGALTQTRIPFHCQRRICTMHTSAADGAIAHDHKPVFAGKSGAMVTERSAYVTVMSRFHRTPTVRRALNSRAACARLMR
jgi:hypothetical protein